MSSKPTENSSDDLIDERQIELGDSGFSDPYIAALMAEKLDHETPEDIGFQDCFDIFSD